MLIGIVSINQRKLRQLETCYPSLGSALEHVNVAVAPGERRRGLARRLLGFALRRAARAGARRAFLELRAGNQGALALYESVGFRPLSRRRDYYSEPVEDGLVLVREELPGGPGQEP